MSVLLGNAAVVNPQIAVVFLVGVGGLAALGAPTYCWILAAAISAILFPGLVGVGVLPSVATFVSIPLAWGALAAALSRQQSPSRLARIHLCWFGALALAVLFAWLANFSDPLRPLLDLALLGQPFAVIGALLIDPPAVPKRRVLVLATAALIGIQVPFAIWQLLHYGRGDAVQGTLYNTGAGAHVIGGLACLGAFCVFADSSPFRGLVRVVLAVSLLAIPFLSDAKQVIFALPVAIILGGWRGGKLSFAIQGTVVAVSVGVLITQPALNYTYAIRDIQRASSGDAGKIETARFIWRQLSSDPASLALGKGPAETVSRAAFMTTPAYQKADSPLRRLGLSPAQTATALQSTTPQGSAEAPLSSALGVLGDLGLAGALAYGGLLATLFVALRRSSSPLSSAARSSLVLFAGLGLVSDWWEEPAFTVTVGIIVALSVTHLARSGGSGQQELVV